MLQYQARVIYMKKQNEYPIENFYVGELYLYKQFAGMTMGTYIPTGLDKIERFLKTGAINFQQDMISKYIDWENRREYTGFLTIFYKEGNDYICLHDGKTYQLGQDYIIDNLHSLKGLLPKIDIKRLTHISMYDALELFDILFKQESIELYTGQEQKITDFYVGDLALPSRTPIEPSDRRTQYIHLPHHMMLENSELCIHSFSASESVNTVYRCLFLKDNFDLYNLNNHQFYNPNEDAFESIIPFKDYMSEFEIKTPTKKTTIPKALRLFKKTL